LAGSLNEGVSSDERGVSSDERGVSSP